MRADRPLLLLLAALTAGCADPEPFVDQGIVEYPTVSKPRDTVLTDSRVKLCYSDKTPWSEVEALAAERCGAYGLKIYNYQTQRYQCRATSPHTATFVCYDPEMLDARGAPINVFDVAAVQEWEKRTGKRAKPHNSLGGQGAPATAPAPAAPPEAPPAPAQPAPAPVSMPMQAPLKPLTPADIASRPPMQPLPPRPQTQAAPPTEGAYPTEGFTLPQGSWGDHFQE